LPLGPGLLVRLQQVRALLAETSFLPVLLISLEALRKPARSLKTYKSRFGPELRPERLSHILV